MPRALVLALALSLPCAAGGLPAPGHAQGTARDPALLSERDSIRLLRTARSEQSRFERIRRNHLPWAWGGGGGECDERIGRFCLTYGDSEVEWTPPPEAEEVSRARERLLEQLETAARLLPGDPWIAGQRVRYLVEAKRFDEAGAAADECRADGWWCAALSGFTQHLLGDAGAADSAFALMLRRMPAAEREEWSDLSLILDRRALRAYRGMPPGARERFERRFWELADPFHGRPGNDLRSEHLSRNLMDRLQDRAKSAEGISWGSDLREILIRFGWPSGWERVRPRTGLLHGEISLVSHYSSAGQDLLPPAELLLDSAALAAGQWDEDDARSRTGYNLFLRGDPVRWISPLEHQIAVFRRGDSAVVVAAYELPTDSLPAGSRVDAALALTTGAAERHLTRRAAAGPQAVVTRTAPTGPMLLSLEVMAEEAGRAARVRRGIHLPPRVPGLLAASDLLLLRSAGELPDSLAAAVDDARGSPRVRAGERLGVYWEIYGLEPERPERLTLSLRLVERDKSWLRRLGERIGVVGELEPMRLRWNEQTSRAESLPRALSVQIPAELSPGSYALELTIRAAGREPLVVERDLEVVR